jgi:cation:H+ antiporter
VSDLLTTPWPLSWSLVGFVLATVVTLVGGVRLASLGDALADRTGWGEALFGAVFFGLATSLAGVVMTATAGLTDQPTLAYSNAVGGIAAQTVAIAVADAFHRRVNLEHAAASPMNLMSGCLLICLLALALLASFVPDVTVLGVHPMSVVVLGCYLGGLYLMRQRGDRPLWQPVRTGETQPDVPTSHGKLDERGNGRLWTEFVAVGLAVAVGGWAITQAARGIIMATGLSAAFVGTLAMGVVNALPETVTAVAAVRRGAATLAIAAVIGGNSIDVLTLVVGDLTYRGGSLFHRVGTDELLATAFALLMSTILLGGLIVRQSRGLGRLGFEGSCLVVAYASLVALLAT